MKGTAKTTHKVAGSRTDELNQALKRRRLNSTRFLYEESIKGYREHLEICHRPNCIECKDASLLIAYDRKKMREAIKAADGEFDEASI